MAVTSTRSRLLQAEDVLLTSIQRDSNDELLSFGNSWRTLLDEMTDIPSLDSSDLALANTVATRISIIAQSFMELDAATSIVADGLMPELIGIIGDCNPTKKDTLSEAVPKPSIMRTKRLSLIDTMSPNHLALQKWLVSHLHLPYPTPSQKISLCQATQMSAKAMDDWFTNARRKIGWTAFSKRYFKGNRSLTLDFAHRVFIEGKGCDMNCEDAVRDLEEIKTVAERIYGTTGCDMTEASCFAKELDSVDVQTRELVSRPKVRRLSTTSMNKAQPPLSCSSLSSLNSRKRSRCDDSSNIFSYSEETLRSVKRNRKVVPSSSRESSLTCSSESSASLYELITPISSPTYPKLPLELFDDWIDGISAESAFLPHDANNEPSSVLSHKRPLLDSDADEPAKRIRLDTCQELHIDNHNPSIVPIVDFVPDESTNRVRFTPLLPNWLHHQESVVPPLGDNPGDKDGTELDEEALKQIISQLDFSIPQAPVSLWDESLSNSVLETSLFDFSSLSTEIRPSSGNSDDLDELFASIPVVNAPLADSEEALLVACVPQQNSLSLSNTSEGRISNANGLSMEARGTSCDPISFSALDLEFLESLGIAPQPQPRDALSSSTYNQGMSTTLVDVPSSSQLADLPIRWPEPTNELVSEAYKLQQEVFG